MPVDHGLDLLGMNLQPADIDDAATPADEMVAVTAQLNHVAGIDKSIDIGEISRVPAHISMGGSPRSDTQGAIHDLHLDAAGILADQLCRKALAAVIDGKADARFRRGISMADRGLRKGLRQTIEDRLVGDL